ncbi:MAG: response regulator transcription factor [Anaeroplasmataceae bacterium]|nr:response regulator transcription factor [Anaeroplasmataceae bacterium]
MIKILVVEDDENLNLSVCKHLAVHGYMVKGCLDAVNAIDILFSEKYDLIISDIMMPKMDGFEFARNIREVDKNIPILFMTARDDYSSKEKGFKIGIDDYLVKPIDLDELLLRITALLRRAKIATSKKLVVGNLILDEDAVSAEVDGQPIVLTLREFQIIYKLLSYPNKTFTRGQLLDEFSGYESESGLRSVDVHITNLRQKFENCTGFKINTIRGLGYKAVLL